MKQQIINRDTKAVLFECKVPADVGSDFAMLHALEKAVAEGADLTGADLTGAGGKKLPHATPEQAIENLDKVRAIVMDNRARLNMGTWHSDDGWKDRSCAEEAVCETAHCIAGWLQVCTTERALKEIPAHLAGVLAAPVASKMFFSCDDEAFKWLRDRKYAAETAEAMLLKAERAV